MYRTTICFDPRDFRYEDREDTGFPIPTSDGFSDRERLAGIIQSVSYDGIPP